MDQEVSDVVVGMWCLGGWPGFKSEGFGLGLPKGSSRRTSSTLRSLHWELPSWSLVGMMNIATQDPRGLGPGYQGTHNPNSISGSVSHRGILKGGVRVVAVLML